MPKRVMITAEMLRAKGACADQVEKFRKTWPNGATVTKANALKAAKLGLDNEWVADNFLPAPLDDEYWAKLKLLHDEYLAKCKLLYDEYLAKCKPLYDEYWAKCWLVLYPLLRMALSGPAEDTVADEKGETDD